MKTAFIRVVWVSGLGMLLMLPLLLLIYGPASPAAAQEAAKAAPKYIGSTSCAKMCHKARKRGKQLPIWQESSHAKAFATLATPEAKEIAGKMGIADAQKADECLVCHTTAHGVEDGMKGAKFSHEEGVGCEACHGPGSLYKKRTVMKDREKAIAKGMLVPDEATCLKCHNEKSPTYRPFDYEAKSKAIAHLKPEAKG